MRETTLKLWQIGDRIKNHLNRFENNPTINRIKRGGTSSYWQSGAWASGCRLMVQYVSYQGPCSLTKGEAIRYLAWLDAGNVGRHYEVK